jgi:hypothetical protein
MQPHTCLFAATALILGTAFGTAAFAADPQQPRALPKEGTWKGQYAPFGTMKSVQVGKERVLNIFDEHGATEGDGILNLVAWHCWGLGDYTNGVGQEHGYCVGTDPGGDQIAIDFSTEKHSMDQLGKGSFKLTTGTGKFTGISGNMTFAFDMFRPSDDGTYFGHNTSEGVYKLP